MPTVTYQKQKRKFHTFTEIEQIAATQKNAYDRALILLLAEGVRGDNCFEIIHVKQRDFNEKRGLVTIHQSDGQTRFVRVRDVTKNAIVAMLQDETYQLSEGTETTYEPSEQLFRPLTPYKPNGRNNEPTTHITEQFIMRTLKRIGAKRALHAFTPFNIYRSGMLSAYLDCLYEQNQTPITKENVLALKDVTDDALGDKIGIPYGLKIDYTKPTNLAVASFDVTYLRQNLLNQKMLHALL